MSSSHMLAARPSWNLKTCYRLELQVGLSLLLTSQIVTEDFVGSSRCIAMIEASGSVLLGVQHTCEAGPPAQGGMHARMTHHSSCTVP